MKPLLALTIVILSSQLLFAQEKANIDLSPALFDAVERHNEGAVRSLLNAGADANSTDKSGHYVLALAAQNGDLPILRLLLASGAKPNAGDEGNSEALQACINTARVQYLTGPRRVVWLSIEPGNG